MKYEEMSLSKRAAVGSKAPACVKLRTSGDILGIDKYVAAPGRNLKICPEESTRMWTDSQHT